MPSLVFYRDDQKLLEYRLRPGRTTIGRADSCDIALPGDQISRTHCFVEGHGGNWTLIDRSRHGTTLDGKRARRETLKNNAEIGIGGYHATFIEQRREAAPTMEAYSPLRTHEQVLFTEDEGLQVRRARLVIVDGNDVGRELVPRRAQATLGGPGSDLVLPDPMAAAEHCRLRVARGRLMVEPRNGPVWFEGQRLRMLTPILPGEEFRVGQTTLRMDASPMQIDESADRFGEMLGVSRAMRRVFGRLRILAGHEEPVLIMGESGTGKELAAQALHQNSPRAEGPFIPVNCGGLAADLLNSELFGYEKGAFTGADERRDGAFQRAHQGTLFLDELGELPLEAQASLLRALGGNGVRRVGGFVSEFPDVRVIAATNRDMVREVRRKRFREDLFFRLETLFIHLPPLRTRHEDIELLAPHIARQVRAEATVTPDAMQMLMAHTWPGNVRELANVIRRAVILGGPQVKKPYLMFHDLSVDQPDKGEESTSAAARKETSRDTILHLLRMHNNNRAAVARELGVSRSTLIYRMKRLGLA
ncbi:MAG: sigma 54-interacting transcriptional regulator [Myxococcota bacterium]